MKYIIAIAFILISSMCYGELVRLKNHASRPGNPETVVKTVCLHGYLFAVAESYKGGISITQMFEYNGQGSSLAPIKCKTKGDEHNESTN